MPQQRNFAEMTGREAAEFAFGANAFPAGFPENWEIEDKTFSKNKFENSDKALQAAKDWAKQKRSEGWTVKRKSYSMFISLTAVRPRK